MFEITEEKALESGENPLQEQWSKAETNEVILGLRRGEDLANLIERLPGYEAAFCEPDVLECADGRVCDGHKIALAGEGLLLDEADRAKLVSYLKAHNIKKVTGHEHCGAAAIACPGPESDAYGYQKAVQLASECGCEYSQVAEKDFLCPVHNERLLVLDETGRFDCANLSGFPAQFLSSAPAIGLSDKYLKMETAALTGIALGDHGFGERFDRDHPFYIVIAATTPESMSRLQMLAQEAVADHGDRVRVLGFVPRR